MKTLRELLIELDACEKAIEWAQDKTIEQAVAECERADWILWLAQKVKCDRRQLVLCGGLCAGTVSHLMADKHSINAVDVAIAYGQHNATKKELAAAWSAAWAAAWSAASDAARSAASDAAWAAAWSAASAAASAAASDAEKAAARDAALKEMAEIVRPIIARELIDKVNKLLQ